MFLLKVFTIQNIQILDMVQQQIDLLMQMLILQELQFQYSKINKQL